MNKFSEFLGKVGAATKEASPVIFLVTGLTAGAAAIVSACMKTEKAKNIVEEAKNDVADINQDYGVVENYTEQDKNKDLKKVYMGMVGGVIKEYLPAIALETVSIASIIVSYAMMRKKCDRLTDEVNKLTASVSAISAAFAEYRARVAEKYGKDAEYELAHGIVKKTETVTKEDGTTEEVETVEYGKNLDPLSILWGPEGMCQAYDMVCGADTANKISALYELENMANNEFKRFGHLSLGWVAERILKVMPENIPACWYTEYGWVRGYGDDFVDFGLKIRAFYSETQNDSIHRWNYGENDNLFLQFNVQSNYTDLCRKAKVML